MSHTIKPWIAVRPTPGTCFITTADGSFTIARVYLVTHRALMLEEALDNARLIATAPDFRAACELLITGDVKAAVVAATNAFISESTKL